MTIPLIVLALLSTFGGLVGVPYALSSLTGGHPENYFERTLEPVISEVPGRADSETATQPLWRSAPPQPFDGKPAVEVAVKTEVTGDLAELRPPTGIEPLPPPPSGAVPTRGWAAGTVGLAGGLFEGAGVLCRGDGARGR